MAVIHPFPPICTPHLHLKMDCLLYKVESGLLQPIEYGGNDIVPVSGLAFVWPGCFYLLLLGALSHHFIKSELLCLKDHSEEHSKPFWALGPDETSHGSSLWSSMTAAARQTHSEVCPDRLIQLTKLEKGTKSVAKLLNFGVVICTTVVLRQKSPKVQHKARIQTKYFPLQNFISGFPFPHST